MTKKLHDVCNDLHDHVRDVGRSGNLSLLLGTERNIIANDLFWYGNSKAMISSLRTALTELDVVKDHIKLVSNPDQYDVINKGHSLSKHRKGGLPQVSQGE